MWKILLTGVLAGIAVGLYEINNKLNCIKMTNQEAIDKVNALTTQVNKVRAEVQKLIDAAQNQGNVSPELEAAINSAQTALQGVDDLNEDATTGEPPVEPQP